MAKNYSILRQKQDEEIAFLSLDGEILDVGGDKGSSYNEKIKGVHTIYTINVDPTCSPDKIVNIEERFPFEDGQFDHVICFNVLEHIFETQHVFSELVRVTKPGGKIVVSTPMTYHIHGSPDDYMRYTDSTYKRLAAHNSCEVEKLIAFNQGFLSVGFGFIGGAIPTSALRQGIKFLVQSLDTLLQKYSKRYRLLAARIPMGYFAIFVKSNE